MELKTAVAILVSRFHLEVAPEVGPLSRLYQQLAQLRDLGGNFLRRSLPCTMHILWSSIADNPLWNFES